MKYNAILFATAMVLAAVSAEPDPDRCWRRGMPCSKLKRAVEITNAILDEPVADHPDAAACFQSGQPCAKAKRAETALKAALSDAALGNYESIKTPKAQFCEKGQPCPKKVKNVARSVGTELERKDDPIADHSFCHKEGNQCHKVKRAAEALASALAEPEAEADPDRCWRRGMPCSKVKRDALAEPEAEAEPEPDRCWRRGMPCSKAKRDRCWRRGMPCSKAKRALDDLYEAADDAVHYVTEDLPGSDYSAQ